METKKDEWSPDETYAAERAALIAQIYFFFSFFLSFF